MKKRSDYRICENCGASLDVGEICDCKDLQAPKMTQQAPCNEKGGEVPAKIQGRLYGAKWALYAVISIYPFIGSKTGVLWTFL